MAACLFRRFALSDAERKSLSRTLRERARALVHFSECKYMSALTAAVTVAVEERAMLGLTCAVVMAARCRAATVKGSDKERPEDE